MYIYTFIYLFTKTVNEYVANCSRSRLNDLTVTTPELGSMAKLGRPSIAGTPIQWRFIRKSSIKHRYCTIKYSRRKIVIVT